MLLTGNEHVLTLSDVTQYQSLMLRLPRTALLAANRLTINVFLSADVENNNDGHECCIYFLLDCCLK